MMRLVGEDGLQPTRPYRSSSRQEQARRTRLRVLDAAGAVFRAHGYAAATMRAIAAQARVSVPTVELLFGTKARLLKAAIDVAIAGDDQAVPVLDRGWTQAARQAATAEEFLTVIAGVVGPAQDRSAGLVLAVFEGSAADADLAELARQMVEQRRVTVEWIVAGLTGTARLRADLDQAAAVDTLWILMDPAIFDRLVRHRGWTLQRYQDWFTRSARRLLVADHPTPTADPGHQEEL
jgi:TetR/AcrR family transcriptional regulator of autoinduction and epiphytic fitness